MILVFGTICVDRILRVPRLPVPGGYVEVESEQVFLGGEGANTAHALHRWGCEVVLAGNPCGAGPLADMLTAKGLSNWTDDACPGGNSKAPVCDIYVTPDGERTMFGRGFSSMAFPAPVEDVPYGEGQWFTAEPNISPFSREVVREAHARGMKVFTMDFIREDDPIPRGSYWQSSTDWVGAKDDEAANLAWVSQWTARHGCTSILSDGDRGLFVAEPSAPPRWLPAFPAPKIVDTTGAGDMLRAGTIRVLERGGELSEALAFAAAAAALKCGTLGATESVPSVREVEDHIGAHPEIAALYTRKRT